jgi:hypothetical protein
MTGAPRGRRSEDRLHRIRSVYRFHQEFVATLKSDGIRNEARHYGRH